MPEGVQVESRAADAAPFNVLYLLGSWEDRRYDFHWYKRQSPAVLQLNREHQQDALRYIWTGLVAGTDGGLD